mgnify:FL=1
MAEVKNAFIKSKMNKDLDSRLLPSGEYRDGQNIQVSKSESEDVGALENAVGNVLAVTSSGIDVDFSLLCGLASGTLESIGVYADTNSGNIFVFLTDFGSTDTSIVDPVYSASANNVIFSYNVLTKNTTKLVQGAFLNFSRRNPIYGINLLENLLFWTDNRNQPRKINIDRASAIEPYYTTEDTLSVAKYNPYKTIELYYEDTSATTPIGNSNPNQGQYVTSCQDVVSEFLPDGTTNNMYYNPSWPGDTDYLEDKFVSFSYRFEFIDGEYSIMAPFTQEAFIPKQDGYFLEGDEKDTYRSTIVRFMENKVNDVGLYIPLPFDSTGVQLSPSTLSSSLSVKSIDILYKESDSLTVRVLDSVPCDLAFRTIADLETPNTDSFYKYDYQSRKPYKTLPESDIVRVYDKVPVRAFGQEVISNRIVYSNFQDKHTPPATLDYDVAVTSKSSFSLNGNKAGWNTSIIEYPEHTVKQNRNYQVGFVLSDRFGRQSTTILSPVGTATQTDPNGIVYGGSTFYHPYSVDPGTNGNNIINTWPGDSIKVLINKAIDSSLANAETGWPGLYNGDANNDLYNPLGWYSYKIVVKQTEQEYYNVYLPGILDGYPDFGSQQTPPDPEDTIAHITLIGDNINKVPRDLTEVGPEQRQYRSDVKLYGRVTPDRFSSPTMTIPYYPQTNPQLPVAIAEQNYIFTDAATDAPYGTIYQSDSDPYIARLSQGRVSTAVGTTLPPPIGSLQKTGNPGGAYNILLGVFETNPVESLLDIFWETSTTGLIEDLNAIAGVSNSVDGFVGFDFIQTEATEQGGLAINGFAPAVEREFGLQAIQTTIVLDSVVSSSGPITGNWSLVLQDNQLIFWNLVVEVPMYYDTVLAENSFTFNFVITDVDGNTSTRTVSNIRLGNVPPTIETPSTTPFTINISNPRIPDAAIFTFEGVNGSSSTITTSSVTDDLTWSFYNNGIFSQVLQTTPPLYINAQSGELTEPSGEASGNFDFQVAVRDSGNAEAIVEIKAVFGQEQINTGFGKAKNFVLGPGGSKSGLTSAGVYWCESANYTNAITSDPLPAPMSNTTGKGRVPFAGLENTQINANGANLVTISPTQQSNEDTEGFPYQWNNNNYSPKYPNLGGVTSSGLEAGTAYIKLDLTFKSWPYFDNSDPNAIEDFGTTGLPGVNDQIGVAWPIYLQYRPNVQTSWITAVDVEGQDILFGGVNTSSNLYSDPFAGTGFVSNYSQSSAAAAQGTFETSGQESSIAEVSTTFPQSGNASETTATASRVFVFGKDQGYINQNNDKLGEYRLLIRYPQNNDSRGGRGNNIVVPVGIPVTNTLFGTNGVNKVNNRIKSILSFGDFYYPDGNNSPTSYAYQINGTGNVDENTASGLSPNVSVYAREWSFKYVTQFYTDPDLSTEYTGTEQGKYYSYRGINAADNTVSMGTENSFVSENNIFLTNTSVLNNKTNINRIWVAQFNGNGKKIIATARPAVQEPRV